MGGPVLLTPTITLPKQSGGGGSPSKYPCGSRDLTVSSDIALSTATPGFTLIGIDGLHEGGGVVAMGNYGGEVEIAGPGGQHWYPFNPGSAWPARVIDDENGRPLYGIVLRRLNPGSGKLVVAAYDDHEVAASMGVAAAGSSSTSSDSDPSATTVTVVALGAGALFTRGANTRYVIVVADADNVDPMYVAPTAALAVAGSGLELYAGASSDKWFGAIATGGTSGDVAYVLEFAQ